LFQSRSATRRESIFAGKLALTMRVASVIFLAIMKLKFLLVLAAVAVTLPFSSPAQNPNAPAATNAPVAAPKVYVNSALVPEKHEGQRTDLVMARAQAAPGDYDLEFIGDSITDFWEGTGKNVWQEYYGHRKAINLGVSGDRTQHVLWRFEHGQLDGIKAKVAVVMIGTNNSGGQRNNESEILAGVNAIIQQIRTRQPETKILLLGIFPRGGSFNAQRGQILQVNQALARLDDGKNLFYLDFGSQLIENDGSIDKGIMKDALHPTEAGYKIWAAAMEPKLKELLGEK
jgi:lysophospholipase L1-like esterase